MTTSTTLWTTSLPLSLIFMLANPSINLLITSLTPSHLYLGNTFDNPVDYLPFCLIYLSFGHAQEGYSKDAHFNKSINHLPPSLQTLSLSNYFNQPVLSLPPSLTHLSFGYFFNQPILCSLPPYLTSLFLGMHFDHPLSTPLPKYLMDLSIHQHYSLPLPPLPPHLVVTRRVDFVA